MLAIDNNIKELTLEEFTKVGYGVAVPLEYFKNGNVTEVIKKCEQFDDYFIKNPKLGSLLKQLQGDLQLNRLEFMKMFHENDKYFKQGQREHSMDASFRRIIRNAVGIKMQNLVVLPEKEIVRDRFNDAQMKNLRDRIEQILTGRETQIIAKRTRLNLHPNSLEKIRIGNELYAILPTSKFEIKVEREKYGQWISEFYEENGRAPTQREFMKICGGFLNHELKSGRTYNDILKNQGVPINFEMKYDWTDPEHRKLPKEWSMDFYEQNGRAPMKKEFGEVWGGFITHEKAKGKTYNDSLREWKLPLNFEKKYDWTNPEHRELPRKWASLFFEKHGRAPTQQESEKLWGGFLHYEQRKKNSYNDILREWKLPLNYEKNYDWTKSEHRELPRKWVLTFIENHGRTSSQREFGELWNGFIKNEQRNGKSYNDILTDFGLPNREISKFQKEGRAFHAVGKEFSPYLYNKPLHEPFIRHPFLKTAGRDHLKPDEVVNSQRLKIKNNVILLNRGQRLDKIVEYKRSFHALEEKDWELYTKVCKEMDVYLLKGEHTHSIFKNGCKITFYSKNDLIGNLKDEINEINHTRIKKLIEEIEDIDSGILNSQQSKISEYLSNR